MVMLTNSAGSLETLLSIGKNHQDKPCGVVKPFQDATPHLRLEKQQQLAAAQSRGALEIASAAVEGPSDAVHHDEVLYRKCSRR